ncbi:hypothetical protein BDW68DRAFT_192275 [Aspergillus falconensis]
MVDNGTAFHLVVVWDTCAAIADDAGTSLTDFVSRNPGVGSDCSGLWLDYYVCIATETDTPTRSLSSTVSTTTTTATTTSTGNGATTQTPYGPGIIYDCHDFHLEVSGDTCASIVSDAGVTLDNFYAWNPAVENDCSGLWLNYMSVGVV